MRIKLSLAIGLVLMLLSLLSCASYAASFDGQLGAIMKPYRFSIAGWELKTIPSQVKRLFDAPEKVDNEVNVVLEFFFRVDRIKTLTAEAGAIKDGKKQGEIASIEDELSRIEEKNRALQEIVGDILAGQIKNTLSEQGIYNPIDSTGIKITFPPINFRLDRPPHVLVVSPRDKIESLREITIHQDIAVEQMESVESRVDALGVSSLVVELGGFGGTYPTFVVNNADLRFTIDTATEEWMHQFMAFKPLGFRYMLDLLGIARNYEIATINETVASMVSKEIGSMVYKRYYADQIKSEKIQTAEKFDFNREMREIRRNVDKLLVEGKIEQAEGFMEQRRQYLEANGYYIRKLNQAYFAFHGTYADSPTSISPIGADLRKLRSKSASLKEFVETVSGMTSRQDLTNRLK